MNPRQPTQVLDPLTQTWVPYWNPKFGPVNLYWWAVEYNYKWDQVRLHLWMQAVQNWMLNYMAHPEFYPTDTRPAPPRFVKVGLTKDYEVTETEGDVMGKLPPL